MNNKINVGLIGFGIGGQVFHAPIISSIEGFFLKNSKGYKTGPGNIGKNNTLKRK